jgi:hypothetical protein
MNLVFQILQDLQNVFSIVKIFLLLKPKRLKNISAIFDITI